MHRLAISLGALGLILIATSPQAKADVFTFSNLIISESQLVSGISFVQYDAFAQNIPGGFSLFGNSNAQFGQGYENYAIYSAIALTNETLSFDWTYATFDTGGSQFDRAGFLVNGVFTNLSPSFSPASLLCPCAVTTGELTLTLAAGDTYGFFVHSADSRHGPGEISVIFGPVAAPGPIAGAGLPGLLFGFCSLVTFWRRRRATVPT